MVKNDYDEKKDSWGKYAQAVLYSSIVKDSIHNRTGASGKLIISQLKLPEMCAVVKSESNRIQVNLVQLLLKNYKLEDLLLNLEVEEQLWNSNFQIVFCKL